MTKRMHSVISVLVAFAMVLFMGLSTLGISAGAVTQSEIDALAKKKKDLQSQQDQNRTAGNLRFFLIAATEYVADLHTGCGKGKGGNTDQ